MFRVMLKESRKKEKKEEERKERRKEGWIGREGERKRKRGMEERKPLEKT